jgi:DNA topoisomerase-3
MQNMTRKAVRPIDSEAPVKIRSIQAWEYKTNSAAMSAWIDKSQGSNPGKGRRKTIAKNSKPAATKSTKPTKRPRKPEASVVMVDATYAPVAEQRDTSANTPLRIPYGNKEAAQKLGARYAEGGWYAPPGVDLTELKSKGWL